MSADRPQRGRFISFEGGEGAGKSTQIRLLGAALENAGHPVLQTREPGGSPGAEEIRSLLVTGDGDRWTSTTEVLLHFAARADHMERIIRPVLEAGTWVLCDRFVDSSMAYQGVGQGLGEQVISDLTNLVVGSTMPDLTLVLDLPVQEGLSRAGSRGEGEDRYEKMGQAFHETLRQAFLDIANGAPNRCSVIDATGDVDGVHQAIWAVATTRFDL